MDYAALIVGVGAEPASDARVRLAAGLAERFGAALIGVAAEAVLVPSPVPPMHDTGLAYPATPLMEEEEEQRVRARLAAARDRFQEALPPGVAARAEWRCFTEDPARALAREARSADLLVIGGGGASANAGDVLMRAGRPVLVAPEGLAALHAREVVVGWRDAPQTRRAVADALPLLRRAEGVLVLEVAERGDDGPRGNGEGPRAGVEAVVRWLERHGVPARCEARPLAEGTVADELANAARQHGADLIVSGGYGHARLREWAFGGVTRDLLTRCPVPCLLSH